MDYTSLIKIGLNNNEAKVYLSLLKKGSASAGELIKDTEFHRNIVYDNLEKLVDKGLVSFIIEGKKKIFQITSEENISLMLEKEQDKLNQRKKVADQIKNEIKSLIKENSSKQEATIFRGIKGLKIALEQTLDAKEYLVFGAPQASLDIMGETYWQNYSLKRENKKITGKLIFNEEIREWGKVIKSPLTEVRFLPKKFDSLTETTVFGDKVLIIVWTEKPIATLIKDKSVADNYKKYFELLWKQAKK